MAEGPGSCLLRRALTSRQDDPRPSLLAPCKHPRECRRRRFSAPHYADRLGVAALDRNLAFSQSPVDLHLINHAGAPPPVSVARARRARLARALEVAAIMRCRAISRICHCS
eukprot:682743-Pyramimonas_sp.AAC.1